MKWSIGMTTAPRPISTYERSLGSVYDAGFEHVSVFDDAVRKLGCFANWYCGLTELYMREPFADAYMMIQDDVIFDRRALSLLEGHWRDKWPKDLGVINLWIRGGRETSLFGFHKAKKTRFAIGACCLVFPQSAIHAVLSDRMLLRHRRDRKKGTENIDGALKRWMQRRVRHEYCFEPSLTQHIGVNVNGHHNSSLGAQHARRSGKLVSNSFTGEENGSRVG